MWYPYNAINQVIICDGWNNNSSSVLDVSGKYIIKLDIIKESPNPTGYQINIGTNEDGKRVVYGYPPTIFGIECARSPIWTCFQCVC